MMTLKELRKFKGVSQQKLAKIAGISQSYIASMELGQLKNPSQAIIKKLAQALEVSLTEIMSCFP